MAMTIKEALDAFQSQNTATDKLWAYFSAVSLAVAGYAISAKGNLQPLHGAAIALAYAVFCVNNNMALGAAQTLLVSLGNAARTAGAAHDTPLSIVVLSARAVRWGQGLMAASVACGVLALVLLRDK